MKVEPNIVKKVLRSILKTREQELDCDECFELMDRFVEIELAGKTADEALPLVRDHLDRCGACKEEYEALITVLQSAE